MAAQSKSAVVFSAVLALVIMGVAGAFVMLAPAEAPKTGVEEVAVEPPPSVAVGPEPGAPADPPRSIPAPEPATEASDEPVLPPSRNRMARDLERERIWSALGREHALEPAAPGSAAPSEGAAAHLPSLDPEYVESAISEQLIPVARECYDSALEDDPELAGELVTRFVIVGAEDVGGVVEEAELTEESTLDSAFVRECMRESLMAVTFEPPEDGGRVEMSFSVRFEPD